VQAPASTGAPNAGSADARPGGSSPQAPGDGGGGGGFLDDLLYSSYERQAPGVGEMRHGTEGWRGLETSFWVRGGVTHRRVLVQWCSTASVATCGDGHGGPARPGGALGARLRSGSAGRVC
jgi:hypothetical protein